MRRLISLGYRCEVAFQLRMHSGDNHSHFFDWLLSPQITSIIEVLRRDFDVFAPEHLAVRTNRMGERRVFDQVTGVVMPHAFPVNGRNVVDGFMATYSDFIAKMQFLARRFRDTVANDPVTLVRRGATEAQARDLEEVFFSSYPDADATFLYVLPDGDNFETAHGHSVVLAEKGSQGDARAWAELLRAEGLIDLPFRVSISEITRLRSRYDFGGTALGLDDIRYALSFNPDNPYLHYEASQLARRDGDWEAAQAHIDAAVRLQPDNLRFQGDKLQLDWRNGGLSSEALLSGMIALNQGAEHADLARLIILQLVRTGRPVEALPFFSQYFRDNPFDAQMLVMKAEALLAAGRFAEAELAAARAIDLEGDTVAAGPAWRLRAEIRKRKGDAAGARAAEDEAVRLESTKAA